MRPDERRLSFNPFALCAALAFAVVAWRPDWGLRPLDSLVAQMRRPDQALPVARMFFASACAVSLALGIWWQCFVDAIARSLMALASWGPAKFWLITAGLAIAPRALALLLPYEPMSDAGWYERVAGSLARDEGLVYDGHPTAFRSPGYPYLLSLAYRLGGERLVLAWVLGAFATGVLLVSMFRITAQLYDVTRARTAVLLAAGYPALVLMTGQTMSDLVFTAGMFALVAFALGRDGEAWRDALFAGVAAGALTLVRTVGMGLFVLIPALWWMKRRDPRLLARNAVVAACGCAALLVPWMLHNAESLGRFTIGTNGGSNLLVGNRMGASGIRDAFALPDAVAAVCDRGDEVACDDAMTSEAIRFVLDHPADALALLPRKLVGMYLMENAAVTSLFQGERHGPDTVRHVLYGVSQLVWLFVAALLLVRIMSWRDPCWRPSGAQAWGWLLTAYFTAICLVFFGSDRYRLPLLPWFLIEASVALRWIAQPRKRSIRPFSSSSDAN